MTKVNAHQSRIFSLGIGDGASHELIEGIAKAGGGTCSFCSYNENIDKKVLLQLKNAMEPSLTGKKVHRRRTRVISVYANNLTSFLHF